MTTNAVKRLKILFLCTGNSCRSQMAEETLTHYSRVRDEIKTFIETLPEALLK